MFIRRQGHVEPHQGFTKKEDVAHPTTTMARRRWAGIFSLDNSQRLCQTIADPGQTPSDPYLHSIPETLSSHHVERGPFNLPPVRRDIGEVSRHSLLSRSNAVSRRRSETVSRFSTDSSDTDPFQSEKDSSSHCSSCCESSPSTAATTPIQNISPKKQSPPTPQPPSPCEVLSLDAAYIPIACPSGPSKAASSSAEIPYSFNSSPQRPQAFYTAASPTPIRRKPVDTSLSEKLTSAERRIILLEEENRLLKQQLHGLASNGNTTRSPRDVGSLVEKWIEAMHENRFEAVERMASNDQIHALEKQVYDLNAKLRQRDQAILSALDKTKPQTSQKGKDKEDRPADTSDEGIIKSCLERLGRATDLLHSIEGTLTPRKMILLKLGDSSARHTAKAEALHGLLESPFDARLNPEQAMSFSQRLDAQTDMFASGAITLQVCAMCRIPKLINSSLTSSSTRGTPHIPGLDTLNEYIPHFSRTSCCTSHICAACLPAALIAGITRDWWHGLYAENWLKCPIPHCPSVLPLRYNVELTDLLRCLPDSQALRYVRQFERAKLLRSALESLHEEPTQDALACAARLHAQLIEHGRMRPFFDLQQSMSGLNVEMLPVNSADESRTLMVPIFTGLLVGRSGGRARVDMNERDCIICAESINDLVNGTSEDEASWSKATSGFPGDWTWRVRAYPTPSLLPECNKSHDPDICRSCLVRHLETSLDTLGRAGCDRLSCPSPDCGHIYTDTQLRALAKPETFARYDHFRLLNHLATLPNFRWCLREGCEAGQIYDVPDSPPVPLNLMEFGASVINLNNRVICNACSFEMCFEHQVPWHAGMSCNAYDGMRTHGDPAVEATRAWIARHTKPCPGPTCGVPVEKKGGCFHMTCRACSYEFCWECLADWKVIQKRSRKGHRAGCFFRGDGPGPTRLVGNNIEEALREV